MRAAIYTLGCKVNQYETQAMEQELRRRGHELVDFEDSADAYIINTCSVTAVSDKKSRQMIRRARRRSPGAVVAACGCYVQTHTDEAKTLGIDLIGGTGDRMAFLDLLEQEMLSHGSLTALQITQNTMNVDMSGMTLDQISAMFARLRLSPIVDSVSLSVASTEEGKAATIMDFTVRIELRQPEEVAQ